MWQAETVNFEVKVIPIWCTLWGVDWSVKSMWQVVPGEVGRRDTQTRPECWRQTKSGPKWQSDAPVLRVKAPFERESFWLDNDFFFFFSVRKRETKPTFIQPQRQPDCGHAAIRRAEGGWREKRLHAERWPWHMPTHAHKQTPTKCYVVPSQKATDVSACALLIAANGLF